jgi:hypothetical protein
MLQTTKDVLAAYLVVIQHKIAQQFQRSFILRVDAENFVTKRTEHVRGFR